MSESIGIRKQKGSEWTLGRKLAGNFLPVAHWLPTFFLAGLLLAIFEGSAIATLLVMIGVFASLTVGTWKMFDRFGMYQNAEMREALRGRLRQALSESPPTGCCWFVGLATQGHLSLLDTDEDVGYLILYPDRLEYVGDRLHLNVRRSHVLGVERRPIPFYSLTGHYWTVIRYEDAEGKATSVRLLSRAVDRVFTEQPKANRELWEAVKGWYDETGTAMLLSGGTDAVETARQEALRELETWLSPSVPEEPPVETTAGMPEEERPFSRSEAGAPVPGAVHSRWSETGPSELVHRTKELLADGAPWERVRPSLADLLRCFERPEVFRDHHALLMGVYLSLRLGGERSAEVPTMPADDVLLQDPDLASEYERVFGEPLPQEGAAAGGGNWLVLRGARRLQALRVRRMLRDLLAEEAA